MLYLKELEHDIYFQIECVILKKKRFTHYLEELRNL